MGINRGRLDAIEKGKTYPVGTHRYRKDGIYRKVSPTKWVRVTRIGGVTQPLAIGKLSVSDLAGLKEGAYLAVRRQAERLMPEGTVTRDAGELYYRKNHTGQWQLVRPGDSQIGSRTATGRPTEQGTSRTTLSDEALLAALRSGRTRRAYGGRTTFTTTEVYLPTVGVTSDRPTDRATIYAERPVGASPSEQKPSRVGTPFEIGYEMDQYGDYPDPGDVIFNDTVLRGYGPLGPVVDKDLIRAGHRPAFASGPTGFYTVDSDPFETPGPGHPDDRSVLTTRISPIGANVTQATSAEDLATLPVNCVVSLYAPRHDDLSIGLERVGDGSRFTGEFQRVESGWLFTGLPRPHKEAAMLMPFYEPPSKRPSTLWGPKQGWSETFASRMRGSVMRPGVIFTSEELFKIGQEISREHQGFLAAAIRDSESAYRRDLESDAGSVAPRDKFYRLTDAEMSSGRVPDRLLPASFKFGNFAVTNYTPFKYEKTDPDEILVAGEAGGTQGLSEWLHAPELVSFAEVEHADAGKLMEQVNAAVDPKRTSVFHIPHSIEDLSSLMSWITESTRTALPRSSSPTSHAVLVMDGFERYPATVREAVADYMHRYADNSLRDGYAHTIRVLASHDPDYRDRLLSQPGRLDGPPMAKLQGSGRALKQAMQAALGDEPTQVQHAGAMHIARMHRVTREVKRRLAEAEKPMFPKEELVGANRGVPLRSRVSTYPVGFEEVLYEASAGGESRDPHEDPDVAARLANTSSTTTTLEVIPRLRRAGMYISPTVAMGYLTGGADPTPEERSTWEATIKRGGILALPEHLYAELARATAYVTPAVLRERLKQITDLIRSGGGPLRVLLPPGPDRRLREIEHEPTHNRAKEIQRLVESEIRAAIRARDDYKPGVLRTKLSLSTPLMRKFPVTKIAVAQWDAPEVQGVESIVSASNDALRELASKLDTPSGIAEPSALASYGRWYDDNNDELEREAARSRVTAYVTAQAGGVLNVGEMGAQYMHPAFITDVAAAIDANRLAGGAPIRVMMRELGAEVPHPKYAKTALSELVHAGSGKSGTPMQVAFGKLLKAVGAQTDPSTRGYPVGTIRARRDGVWLKVSPTEWKRIGRSLPPGKRVPCAALSSMAFNALPEGSRINYVAGEGPNGGGIDCAYVKIHGNVWRRLDNPRHPSLYSEDEFAVREYRDNNGYTQFDFTGVSGAIWSASNILEQAAEDDATAGISGGRAGTIELVSGVDGPVSTQKIDSKVSPVGEIVFGGRGTGGGALRESHLLVHGGGGNYYNVMPWRDNVGAPRVVRVSTNRALLRGMRASVSDDGEPHVTPAKDLSDIQAVRSMGFLPVGTVLQAYRQPNEAAGADSQMMSDEHGNLSLGMVAGSGRSAEKSLYFKKERDGTWRPYYGGPLVLGQEYRGGSTIGEIGVGPVDDPFATTQYGLQPFNGKMEFTLGDGYSHEGGATVRDTRKLTIDGNASFESEDLLALGLEAALRDEVDGVRDTLAGVFPDKDLSDQIRTTTANITEKFNAELEESDPDDMFVDVMYRRPLAFALAKLPAEWVMGGPNSEELTQDFLENWKTGEFHARHFNTGRDPVPLDVWHREPAHNDVRRTRQSTRWSFRNHTEAVNERARIAEAEERRAEIERERAEARVQAAKESAERRAKAAALREKQIADGTWVGITDEKAMDAWGKNKGKLFNTAQTENEFDVASGATDRLTDILGTHMTYRDVGALVGAPPSSDVLATAPSMTQGVDVEFSGPRLGPEHGGKRAWYGERTIYEDSSGKVVCSNKLFRVHSSLAGHGIGARVFASQVAALQKAGADRILVHAVGNGAGPDSDSTGGWNGYNTWARFGYVPNDQDDWAEKAQEKWESIEFDDGDQLGLTEAPSSIQELMATPEGRAWWRAWGWDFYGQFDLTPGSYSMRTLKAYFDNRKFYPVEDEDGDVIVKARRFQGILNPAGGAAFEGGDVILLSAEDYRALDIANTKAARKVRKSFTAVLQTTRRRAAIKKAKKLPVGTTTTRKDGVQYRKDAPGKWSPVQDRPDPVQVEAARERKTRLDAARQNPDSLLPNLHKMVPKQYMDKIPWRPGQKTVTVYRSVPPGVTDKIRPGDWVTLTRKYAQIHGRGHIIAMEVPAAHVMWAGTDMNEFFYTPVAREEGVQKAKALPSGTITTRKDGQYMKRSSGKWVKIPKPRPVKEPPRKKGVSKLQHAVALVESRIRSLPHEHVYVFSPDGTQVLQKTDNHPQRVNLGPPQIELIHNIDATITHNHPTGQILSGSDIRLAVGIDAKSIRATTPDRGTWVLERPEGGWGVNTAGLVPDIDVAQRYIGTRAATIARPVMDKVLTLRGYEPRNMALPVEERLRGFKEAEFAAINGAVHYELITRAAAYLRAGDGAEAPEGAEFTAFVENGEEVKGRVKPEDIIATAGYIQRIEATGAKYYLEPPE